MPRRKRPRSVATIPNQLTDAANTFAREILRILGATTVSNLCALGQVSGPPAVATERPASSKATEQERGRRPSRRTNALRRIAGARPVSCPVPGCEGRGVRSKMNFCNEHAASLPAAEKIRLRQEQRTSHVAEPVRAGESGSKRKKRAKA